MHAQIYIYVHIHSHRTVGTCHLGASPGQDELIKTMPDVVYLQEDPLVPGGLVAFPAALAPDDPGPAAADGRWRAFLLFVMINGKTVLWK